MENTEERKSNSDKTWKIWKKGKLNSKMIWKIWKKGKWKSEKIWKIWRKGELNSEKIWRIQKLKCEMILKIQKKIVKRYGGSPR